MVLDAYLLNTQHYKIWIKGKVEQPWERSSALLGVVAIEKGVIGSPSILVVNFSFITDYMIFVFVHICCCLPSAFCVNNINKVFWVQVSWLSYWKLRAITIKFNSKVLFSCNRIISNNFYLGQKKSTYPKSMSSFTQTFCNRKKSPLLSFCSASASMIDTIEDERLTSNHVSLSLSLSLSLLHQESTNLYINSCVLGVIVIVIGYRNGDMRSNLRLTYLTFNIVLVLSSKVWIQLFSFQTLVGQTGSLTSTGLS